MKKKTIFFSLLSILLIYAGRDVQASNQLIQGPSLTGESSGEVAIRQASETRYYGAYFYLEGSSDSVDLDDEDYSLRNELDLDENTLEIDPSPEYGNATINGWILEYSVDSEFIGTDTFTLIASDTDGNIYNFETTVLVGEADTPDDFQIAINYDAVGGPEVTEISWSGVYTADAYTMASTASSTLAEDGEFSEILTLANKTKTAFNNIQFTDLFSDGLTGRRYLAMKTTRYTAPDYDNYTLCFELPYILLSDPANETKYLPSDYSNYLILDPQASTYPPNTPSGVTAIISGLNQAEVSFSGNRNMLDFKAYEIRYWVDDGVETAASHPVITSTSRSGSVKISNLADKTTYIFQVTAVDYDGNSSVPVQASLYMEKTYSTLQDPEQFEGGCFVSSIDIPVLKIYAMICFLCIAFLLVTRFPKGKSLLGLFLLPLIATLIMASPAYAKEKNTTGIKAGILNTLDDTVELSYDETDMAFGLFYDREVISHFSIEVEAGYIQRDGYEYTESGNLTAIETTMTLVPVSSSIKFNYEFSPLIIAYIGAGPDFWYYKEENDYKEIDAFDDDDYGVGGYHGKIGVYLKTADEYIAPEMGVVLECVYSKIDRFGDNEIDLGGVSFNFGIFYMF